MGHLTTGMDATRKGQEAIEFIPRDKLSKTVSSAFHLDLHNELMEYCDSRRLSAAQLIRYLVAKELRG